MPRKQWANQVPSRGLMSRLMRSPSCPSTRVSTSRCNRSIWNGKSVTAFIARATHRGSAWYCITNKAGPSYRLIQACRQLRSGDRSFRVNLRKGDHLIEVAEAFNDTLDWLVETYPEAASQGEKKKRAGNEAEPVGS